MVVASPPTTALVVNPAFLQEIKDSNPDLVRTLNELRELLCSDQSPKRACCRLARLLDDLREHLALQFSLEESYGYLTVSYAANRALSDAAGRLQAEHRTLYLQLSDLAEQAEELQYRGVELNPLRVLEHQTRQFESRLAQHEQAELALIERVFDLT